MIKQILLTLLILLAVVPPLLICSFVYKKDKHKEPLQLLILFFCLGVLCGVGVIIVSKYIEELFPFLAKAKVQMNMTELLISTFLLVALLEELSKWLMVFLIGYKNREFDESYDIIIYSIFTSLGFATIENILYVIQDQSFTIALERALLSVPAHTSFAIFMSFYLCLAKISRIQNNKSKEIKYILKSIAVPVLFHGIYDLCLFMEKEIFLVVFYAFTILLFVMSIQKLIQLSKTNIALKDINNN